MTYKTLTTVFHSVGFDSPHLMATLRVAEAWSAHLNVLALGTDKIQPGAFYAGAGAIAMRHGMEDAIQEANAARDAATEILQDTTVPWDVFSAVSQMGALAPTVTQYTALADLVVLPRPYGTGRTGEDVAITEAALFSTRTPLLILPEGCDTPHAPKRIVAAWNQSPEALSAIRAAIPLMQKAEHVSIAIIDPPTHDTGQTDPGALLAEMLTRHDIACEISILAKTLPQISDVLLRHASDQNADLVVMGAYGHSRLREAILGGATRNMLEHCSLPILMAH